MSRTQFNEIEKSVLRAFCVSENLDVPNLTEILERQEVERDFSAVGFFTHPVGGEGLRLMPLGTKFTGGRVGARINSSKIETGYLLFIEDGFLKTLEGYTYEEEWPAKIDLIETYVIDNSGVLDRSIL